MADEDKPAAAEAPKKKSAPIKWIVLGVVALVVVGAAALFFLRRGGTEHKPETTDKPAAEAAPKGEHGKSAAAASDGVGLIFDLDPFVVNLADANEVRYLKVTLKLELADARFKPDIEARITPIRDSLLILLSSKDYAGIRTVEGKLELRDEILQRVNLILKDKKVNAAYFTEFVAQ